MSEVERLRSIAKDLFDRYRLEAATTGLVERLGIDVLEMLREWHIWKTDRHRVKITSDPAEPSMPIILARPEVFTAEAYEDIVGTVPEGHQLEQVNCTLDGPGHARCGWCDKHWLPRHVCGCCNKGE